MSEHSGVNPYRHLQHSAQIAPGETFLESGATTMSNAEADSYVRKLAFSLRKAGLRPGSLVALDLPVALGLLFTEALFHEALISCALPYRYAGSEPYPVDWIIGADPARKQQGARFLHVDGAFLRGLERNPTTNEPRDYESSDSICRLVFTSGTTGKPKAVALSYDTIEFRSQTARTVWMRDERFMSLLDASTVSGFFTFYGSVAGGRPYLAPGSMPDNIAMLKKHSIASIKTSPSQVALLVHVLETTDDHLPALKSAQVAGSVLPTPLAKRLRARSGCEIFNMYGSTEVGTVVARYTDSDDPFFAGLPTAGSEVEIVDEADSPVAAGVEGRVRCKRSFMAEGYYRDPENSRDNFKDGWFYPGDLGIIREDGGLELRGRQSDFINAGGVKLDPVQLDVFAASLPLVQDACGFAYLDGAGIQQIGLAVVAPADADVEGYVAALTKAFGPAAPRKLVRVEEIPRNAMGKPIRSVLASQFASG